VYTSYAKLLTIIADLAWVALVLSLWNFHDVVLAIPGYDTKLVQDIFFCK